MTRILIPVIIAAGLANAQAPPSRPPSVSGVVINSSNGEPVRKVTLILAAKDEEKGISYEAESDGNGRFVFQDVQPGDYLVHADRTGFMRDSEGAPGAPPPSLKVESGPFVKDVRVRLVPLGVITGRVLDEDGDPVRGATVTAFEYSYFRGKKQLGQIGRVSANDKGEFRLFGLRPGKVYLRASSRNYGIHRVSFGGKGIVGFVGASSRAGDSATFFPSATDAAHAVPIELLAGAQVHGFDIRLRRDALYSVRGTLPRPLRNPGQDNHGSNYMLQLVSRGDTNEGYSLQMDNESFEFKEVPPGSYFVVCTVDDEKHLSSRQPVEVVNADVEGVTLNLVAPVELSGTLRVEGTPLRPLEHLNVMLQPANSSRFGGAATEVKPDGSFVLQNVIPDVYQLVIGPHPGSYLKSVRLGDEEASAARIDLTKGSGSLAILLGTDVGEVEGTVKKANGDPAARVRVTLIASGKQLGRGDLSRSGFTDEQGKFQVKNIAPGDYEIFAWEDVPIGAPQDPDFRKPFEKQAVAVKMDSNGQASVELKAISVKAAQREGQ